MNIKDLYMSFGPQELFSDINIFIKEDAKVGIIGLNGAGKSTLFKIIKGDLEPTSGKISFKKNTRLGFLPQVISDEIPNTDITVLDFLLSGRPIASLEEDLKSLYLKISETTDEKLINNLMNKISKVQSKLDYWEQYEAENILLKIIAGMNIDIDMLDKQLNQISGGQKSKLAFARLLYSKPEILMLDEPTNHLDKDSKDYIINYLKSYQGMVLVISHDIDFLDAVTDHTLYLDKITHKMELFPGNYHKYLKIKEEREKTNLRTLEKQEKEEEKLKKIIAKYIRGNEKKANIAKDRQKKLARLEKEKVVLERQAKRVSIKMTFDHPGSSVPLKVQKLSFGYSSKLLFSNLSFELIRGEKFLILGKNGVGKSTLLKLIVGKLTPKTGTITIGANVKIAYYAQEHESLDLEKSILDNFDSFDITPGSLRAHLGNFLFSGDDIYKKVKVLSPGERSRVALAKLSLMKANFLILDEPTNHLDPETQKIIADLFKDYEGTILLVSHNPSFVDRLNISRVLILPEGKIEYFSKEKVEYFNKLNSQE